MSKKKKQFCQNLCAASYGNKKRLKKIKVEDPEAYIQQLRKGAMRARKSYEKKKKEVFPNVKIARRPTKYRE